MSEKIGWWLAAIIYIAMLYVLVRPSSSGPELVKTVTGTFADLVRGVAGQTYDPDKKAWS